MGQFTVLPGRVSGCLRKGETLLSHLRGLGIQLPAGCNGNGECGSCRVRIVSGAGLVNTRSPVEVSRQLPPGWRLACQATVIRDDVDISVEIPPSGDFLVIGEGLKVPFLVEPGIRVREDKCGRVVIRGNEVLGPLDGACTGLAIDLGTTTLVLRWYDLLGNSTLPIATTSVLNPQVKFGDNVIDRLSYVQASREHRGNLDKVLRDVIQHSIDNGPGGRRDLYEVVVVGNTVMRDLFFGLPVETLGKAPYRSAKPGALETGASSLGIPANPRAQVWAPPILGQFVGADMLAVILATGMHSREELTMAIDIGTNTEIAIGNCHKIIVTSCASGPAFEGSGVKCGTGAVPGAVREVIVNRDGTVNYSTIGNYSPLGICGSGLLDLLAGLLQAGCMDESGKFTTKRTRFEIVGDTGSGISPIYIDEEDIDAIRLAKAAISTGIVTLLDRWQTTPGDLSALFLAGAFGTSINPGNAERIGLIPPVPGERVFKAGNAAIEGASMLLLSGTLRDECQKIVSVTEHISLETEPLFEDRYIEGLRFGPMNIPG